MRYLPRRIGLILGAACCAGTIVYISVPAGAQSLRAEIRALSERHGFTLDGLEVIGARESATHGSGDLESRLRQLLGDYNFILERKRPGEIERLTIVGRAERDAVEPRSKRNTQTAIPGEQFVQAKLVGPGGGTLTIRLLVDTGASTLVLPDSLAPGLGFTIETLRLVAMQTANGQTDARLGTLRAVHVGEAAAEDVAIAFVPDGHLGGKSLLGMSFLKRFRVTIDSVRGVLALEAPDSD